MYNVQVIVSCHGIREILESIQSDTYWNDIICIKIYGSKTLRILVNIAYQGHGFLGFQIQQQGRTVQQQFEKF